MDLEPLDAVDDRALEADVTGLEAGAGVGAAVDVEGQRLGEVGQPPLELAVEVDGAHLGLDDGQLAELQPGACQRAATEDARPDPQVLGLEARDDLLHVLGGHVEQHEALLRRGRDAAAGETVGELRDAGELRATGAAGAGDGADVVQPVALRVHADVVAVGRGRGRRRRPVGERGLEVGALEHLAEALGPPVGHQELQPRVHAGAPVAVVAEDRDHALPDLGGPGRLDEGAEPDGQLGVGRQAAPDPQVVAGPELRVDHADERDVVDLVVGAVDRAAADGCLELARQVRVRRVAQIAVGHLADVRRAVDDLVSGDAGQRAAKDHARAVAAGLRRAEPDGLEALPDGRDVLDPDPVELDVLPVGDVGDVAAELRRDAADDAQLLGRQLPAVDADPHHEEGRLELFGLEDGGLAAGDAVGPLRVEAVPAEPPAQVGAVDAVEALLAVDVEHALLDRQRVAVLLDLLVGVERLAVSERPLTLSALGGHTFSYGFVTGCTPAGRGASVPVWHHVCMIASRYATPLVARLHVDLQRVSSAICSASK